MLVQELVDLLNKEYPLQYQESYDNSGYQVLFAENKAAKILIALEIDHVTVEEAVEKGCNVIISHHPLIFKPARSISSAEYTGRVLIDLIDNRISAVSLHTNLDKILGSRIAETAGLVHQRVIIEDASGDEGIGLGSYCTPEKPVRFSDLLKKVKEALDCEFLLYGGDKESMINSAAIVNGAGGRMISDIIKNFNVDCIITGDVKYHDILYAEQRGVAVIDPGHYESERIFLPMLKKQLQDCLTLNGCVEDIDIIITSKEKNPFKLFV